MPVQPSWILAASTAKKNSGGSGILLFVMFALLLFFLFRRSQGKARSRLADAKGAITLGSRVITTSGMYATVVRVDDATYDLEVDTDVIITFAKAAVTRLAPVVEDDAAEEGHDHDGEHDHDHDGENDHDGEHDHAHDAGKAGEADAPVVLTKTPDEGQLRSSSES